MNSSMAEITTDEDRLVAAARAGDASAFDAVVAPYRAELQAHCYRMLGSLHDAEDTLQDVLLRAWRGFAGFEGRASLRAWLYRIATNACLTAGERRARRRLPVDLRASIEDTAEVAWLEPYPRADPSTHYAHHEHLELAFVAALQYLPSRQRAALLLCDVLGFSAREAATALTTTTASITSALQHARRTVQERIPSVSQHQTLRALGDARVRLLVQRYMRALEEADLAALLALLAEDATWSMPPMRECFRGHRAITAFLEAKPLTIRWRHIATTANGQPAVACYAWDDARGRYVGYVLDVLTLAGDRIAAVTAFIDPTVFPRFGLPADLAR